MTDIPAWRTESGFDVARGDFPCQGRRVPFIAVTRHLGNPLHAVAVRSALRGCEDSEARAWALKMLLAVAGVETVRWPRADNLKSDSALRRAVTEIGQESAAGALDPNESDLEALDLRPKKIGRFDPEFPQRLAVSLGEYGHGESCETYLAEISQAAHWNVPPGEYGEPSPDVRQQIDSVLLSEADQLQDDPSGFLHDQVREARARENLPLLAGWWEALRIGAMVTSRRVVAEFQKKAVAEACVDPRAQDARSQTRLHDALYTPQAAWAYASWGWRLDGDVLYASPPHLIAAAKSILPLVSVARAQHRDSWWNAFTDGLSRGDLTPVTTGDYRALLHLLAWSKLKTRLPKEGVTPKEIRLISFDDDEEQLGHVYAPVEPTSDLPGPPTGVTDRQWEILIRKDLSGETGASIARGLGLSESTISNELKRTRKIVKDDPGYRALAEEFGFDVGE